MHYCDHALSVVRWRFRTSLQLQNGIELERKQDPNVPFEFEVCANEADRQNQDARPSHWSAETFRLLLYNRWPEFDVHWREARSLRLLPCLYFFSGRSEIQDDRHSLWFAETFSISSATAERNSTKLHRKLLNGFQRHFKESKISTSPHLLCFFFRVDQKASLQMSSCSVCW